MGLVVPAPTLAVVEGRRAGGGGGPLGRGRRPGLCRGQPGGVGRGHRANAKHGLGATALPAVKNPPVNTGNMDLIFGPGSSHIPGNN